MSWDKKMLEFRAKYNLTQKQLSEILGVSSLMIFRYEAGLNKPLPVNKIKIEKIMNEYEVTKND